MKIIKILVVIFIACSFKTFAQAPTGINWMSISEAEKLAKENPKKILVDVYTDWCGWCKRLDATTYKDPKIVEYINKNFYAVKFNAEAKEDITFKGSKYSYDAGRRVNGLSAIMMGNSTGYPTTTFLGENLDVLSNIPGYQNTEMMNNILHFFGDGAYLKMTWDQYLSSLSKTSEHD
ncbi:MAG TPA: DUF255 domain-containing protein [Chitinophagales bacterium]|nr:DUF255 domain-containing protein [Chitinophagales bacterium]